MYLVLMSIARVISIYRLYVFFVYSFFLGVEIMKSKKVLDNGRFYFFGIYLVFIFSIRITSIYLSFILFAHLVTY